MTRRGFGEVLTSRRLLYTASYYYLPSRLPCVWTNAGGLLRAPPAEYTPRPDAVMHAAVGYRTSRPSRTPARRRDGWNSRCGHSHDVCLTPFV